MLSHTRRFVAVAATLVATAAPASAQVYWGGTGLTGTDPFGEVWRIDDSYADASGVRVLNWGIPAIGYIPPIYPAGAPVLTSFQIQFAGGSPILANFDTTYVFATRLLSGRGPSLDPVFWNASVSADRTTATFTSPAGGEVDPGDRWFVNVVFDGQVAPTSFRAVYNGTLAVTATPEPATVALTATGLAGLLLVARRRRRA